MRGMTIVHRLAAGVACLLVLAPSPAFALELGAVETRSALYEPLDARIPVRDARSGDLEGLNVELGSPAQFELAGVARLQHLDLLEFVVVEQGAGGGYIHVRTDEPIIEPSLTFLIDVDWPRGRMVRGYKLRLTPALGRAAGASRTRRTAPEGKAAPEGGATGSAPAPVPASTPASSGTRHGPVRASETLWSIAARVRPDRSVSVQRMMLAILEANPQAFAIRNVNALNKGATLRIPARDEIGPDELQAAIAEVERQHSAWAQYRGKAPATPAPSTPAPAPSAREPEPGGRVEVVSPGTAARAGDREDGAGVEALRNELALATEEADAGRRESNELKLRLAEAEEHIRELNRLVDLKNEEIAALQAALQAMSEAARQRVAAPGQADAAQGEVPVEAEQEPIAASEEAQAKPVEASAEPGPALTPEAPEPDAEALERTADPTEVEPAPVAVERTPADAQAQAEPVSLPFGLGALPVNPVFLVGGAGILLILLGVVALLRRRASAGKESAGEGVVSDVLDAKDMAPAALDPAESDEPDLLRELEAVAAELADEKDQVSDRPSLGALAAVPEEGAELEPAAREAARAEPDDSPEARIASLWDDDRAAEGAPLARVEADDDTSEITFDLDALTGDDAESSDAGPMTVGDDTSDEFDIRDLAGLADLAAERDAEQGADDDTSEITFDLDALTGDDAESSDAGLKTIGDDTSDEFDIRDLAGLADLAAERDAEQGTEPRISGDEAEGDLALLFRGYDDEATDLDTSAPDLELLEDPGHDAPHVTPAGGVSVDPESRTAGRGTDGAEGTTAAAGHEDAGREPDSGRDAGRPRAASSILFDEPLGEDEAEAYPLDEFGEDEVQTKIDLAQVYMEMGDTESARGFLEAALAEGDGEQQETARRMLSVLA